MNEGNINKPCTGLAPELIQIAKLLEDISGQMWAKGRCDSTHSTAPMKKKEIFLFVSSLPYSNDAIRLIMTYLDKRYLSGYEEGATE